VLISTEAIVLKSFKYGDSSKIVTLFTKDEGLITTIAKGARNKKNKYGSSLEPISYIYINFYKYYNKDLYLLSKSELFDTFKIIKNNLQKLTIALALIELVLKVVEFQEKNTFLFDLLLNILNLMNISTSNSISLFVTFQLELIKLIGINFEIALDVTRRQKNYEEFKINIEDFTIHRTNEQIKHFMIVNRESIEIINALKNATLNIASSYSITNKEATKVIELLNKYISYHLDRKIQLQTLYMLNL